MLPRRLLHSLLLFHLVHADEVTTAWNLCLADNACKEAYHQLPANEAVFRIIYTQHRTNHTFQEGEVALMVAQLPLAQQYKLCGFKERYIVNHAGVGKCRCPDGVSCDITPFVNFPMSAACVVVSLALFWHVFY